jgi:UDP-N-acetylglucosamine--N-acetylmuramyl-(pentapeptide) pyrophosphoryl-undecaprenol N-acetylglucosamine transferase
VPPALVDLPIAHLKHLRVSHQARHEDIERVADFYADHGIAAEVETFFDDIPRRMSEAQLVISRAGASSVADVSVIGRPSILIPLASAIRDEQTANARALVMADAAILMPEPGLTVATLSAQIAAFLEAPDKATAMANAALRCAVPDATGRLATLVENLAPAGLGQGAPK